MAEMDDTPLSQEERRHYLRHLALPGFGETGQKKLKHASVLVVGAGGLGSPALMYLAAAGVGTIGIMDEDAVDVSNLQRQILYGYEQQGLTKTDAATKRLESLNPHVRIVPVREFLTADNAPGIIPSYDLVIDGTDNIESRYLINDACHLLDRPWIYGGVFRFDGQISVFGFKDGPCYRCLYPAVTAASAPPDCAGAGVLGVLPGIVGAIQAAEAIKILTGIGEVLSGRLLTCDAAGMHFRELALPRDPDCRLCGNAPDIVRLDRTVYQRPRCGVKNLSDELGPRQLAMMMHSSCPPLLIDIREEWERALCSIMPSEWIPLAELTNRASGLPTDRDIVLYCRSGVRTRHAIDSIKQLPLRTKHLAGGILAWAKEVDPDIRSY